MDMNNINGLASRDGWEVGVFPPATQIGQGRGGWETGFFLRSAQAREVGARLVEGGELPLLLDPEDEGAGDLPLCFVDYAMVERRGAAPRLSVDPGGWSDACRLVGMHAVVFGVGGGLEDGKLERQYAAWEKKGLDDPEA